MSILSSVSRLTLKRVLHNGLIGKCNLSFSRPNHASVVLTGSMGGIGQPLALLMKYNPLIRLLKLHDVCDVKGLCEDLSHIDTSTVVNFDETGDLEKLLQGTDLIVIAAGKPRKPGMTRDDLFKENALIVQQILEKVVKSGVMPKIAIITNPVNSIVPFAQRYFLEHQDFDPEYDVSKRVFGITTLDCVRASTFYAEHLSKDPREVIVPVIGGHSDETMVPLLSLSNIPTNDKNLYMDLTARIRTAGTKVVQAKKGAGSATLSMAYAANRFVNSLLEAHYGKRTTECCYIYSPVNTKINFFSEMTVLDPLGVSSIIPHDKMLDHEYDCFKHILEPLEADIKKGTDFAKECLQKIRKLRQIGSVPKREEDVKY